MKKVKDRYFAIDTPPYDFAELFVFVGSLENYLKKLKKKYGVTPEKPKAPWAAFASHFEDAKNRKIPLLCSIYFGSLKYNVNDYSLLIHEIDHCIIRIFEIAGININSDNSESFCYFHSYLFEEICKQYFGEKNGNKRR